MSGLVITESHIRLRTRGLYWGNSSLPPGSPSLLGPRSTPGLSGIFDFVGIPYCATRFSAKEAWFIPISDKCTTSVYPKLLLVLNWESLLQLIKELFAGILLTRHNDIVSFNSNFHWLTNEKITAPPYTAPVPSLRLTISLLACFRSYWHFRGLTALPEGSPHPGGRRMYISSKGGKPAN